jgi:hypothetical protein
VAIRDSKDDKMKEFFREGWDIETHPGFPLSYDVHRGRKFLALDRSNKAGWFHQAVVLQESLSISPHEIVEKGRVRKGKISHLNAQIAVKTCAMARVKARAIEVGFGPEVLDREVGGLADEWEVRPGRDMLRYLCLMLGAYSDARIDHIMKRMTWWGRWTQRDAIEAILGGFLNAAQEFIAKNDAFGLAKLLQEQAEEAERQIGPGAKGEGEEDEDEGDGKDPNDSDEFDKGQLREPTPHPWKMPKHRTDPKAWWGKMTVVHPPLVASQEIIKRVYFKKSTDAGIAVSDVSRVLTDQKVFRENRPGIKGTVLIDASGSMGLSHEEIFQICAEIPGAVIGVYAGNSSASAGKLIIAANNGRILERKQLAAERANLGSNVVDGPALEWLANMPRPRVWISDGAVTGVGEATGEQLHEDVDRIMLRGHIVRIHALKEAPGAIRYLRARRT